MNKKTFDLIDVTLEFAPTGDKANPYEDWREPVLWLLKAGAEVRKLNEAVDIVCCKFCIRRLVLLEWFNAKLKSMTADTKQQVEELRTWEKQKT